MVTKHVGRAFLAGTVALAIGWASPAAALAQSPAVASAVIRDANGGLVGTAVFAAAAGGVRLAVSVQGLRPGNHGMHIHAVGLCDGPDFATAGGHFNPTNKQHGLNNPNGPHAGDLPQLTVAANGTAIYNTTMTMVTLGSDPNSLLDADHSSIVIHAAADDQMTDPAGNSGARIACGVVVPGAVALPSIAVSGAALPATGDDSTASALPGGTGAATGVLALAALAALCAGLVGVSSFVGRAALRARSSANR